MIYGDYPSSNLHLQKNVVWNVLIVPLGTDQASLVKIAAEFHKTHPNTYFRIFDDTAKVQQWIARDRYFNDQTGAVAAADYPEAWAIAHFIGNIQDKSDQSNGTWQLTNQYQTAISNLE
jgi:hypothetical protein